MPVTDSVIEHHAQAFMLLEESITSIKRKHKDQEKTELTRLLLEREHRAKKTENREKVGGKDGRKNDQKEKNGLQSTYFKCVLPNKMHRCSKT